MPKAQSNNSKHNKNTLENNERNFLTDQLSIVSVPQLSDTECATSKNEQNGRGQTQEKGIEAPAKRLCAAGPQVPNHVVGEAAHKCGQDNDLQRQTGHGDVHADLVVAVGVGGQGAAGGLENQADDVEGDEDPVEELGVEAGQIWGEVYDRLGESDVDGCGVEDGRDGEAYFLEG